MRYDTARSAFWATTVGLGMLASSTTGVMASSLFDPDMTFLNHFDDPDPDTSAALADFDADFAAGDPAAVDGGFNVPSFTTTGARYGEAALTNGTRLRYSAMDNIHADLATVQFTFSPTFSEPDFRNIFSWSNAEGDQNIWVFHNDNRIRFRQYYEDNGELDFVEASFDTTDTDFSYGTAPNQVALRWETDENGTRTFGLFVNGSADQASMTQTIEDFENSAATFFDIRDGGRYDELRILNQYRSDEDLLADYNRDAPFVPEPQSALLLTAGSAVMLVRRRKRTSAN